MFSAIVQSSSEEKGILRCISIVMSCARPDRPVRDTYY